jgi:uncharacterized protein YegL
VPSTTLSYSDKEEGSWQYTKSAYWLSKNKARINIKVDTLEKNRADYADVILVLDTSGSMLGDKLAQVQTDINNLINDTIPKGNKVALITFNDTATIINDFTNDASLLQESINNLTVSGETNYYQALVKVDEVLNTYEKLDNRDCVILFLTDGLPTIDTPNEVSQYKYLKSKYEYLSINGIQYELGDDILASIQNITDTQYVASQDSLNEFLYKASLSAATYDEFTLTDYVDTNYFNLNNVTDINTTFGKATIQNNKVIWNLSGLKSGTDASLTIDINLNNDLIGVGGIYPTHTNTDITYKIGNIPTTESTNKTTILKDKYTVVYEGNTPAGCVVSNVPSTSSYFVFDTVQKENTIPVCAGYQFQGWEIITAGVEEVNDDSFIMPEKNVTLRAVWKKMSITKSMDGKIAKVQTLYRLMADSSIGLDTDVDFSKSPTDANSGVYTIASTENDEYPVHYYRGNIDNNNVLFAGFCWKMVRTTSTGGVKLIYNGIYGESNKCNNTGTASQIGTSAFNWSHTSLADAGYMYGTEYAWNWYIFPTVNILNQQSTELTVNYYYGTSVTYSSLTGRYALQNASLKSWSDNYSSLTGYYTCRSTSSTCSTVYYIAGATSSYQYTVSLSEGVTDPDAQTITLGKSITDNGDGTYTLSDIETVKKVDWFAKYSTYKNYYMCKDLTSTVCDNKYIIARVENYYMRYDNTYNFIYGNDVAWDGTKYTLTDTFTSSNTWSIDRTAAAKKYHYTCFNTSGICSTVNYITSFRDENAFLYYIKFSSGKNIEDAKNEMFTSATNSAIKQAIDTWYKANLTSYTVQLEDTIWCNDRTLYEGALVGKNENAGNNYTHFSSRNRYLYLYSPSVKCGDESRDGFTVSTDSGGNGALAYPIGILTADEVMFAGGTKSNNTKYYLYNGQIYWLLSPSSYMEYSHYISVFIVTNYGELSGDYNGTAMTLGVRPSVSLAPGTRTVAGDGTVYDPYVIEEDEG